MESQTADTLKKGMKNMKKTIAIIALAVVLLVGTATVALAADGWKTPAETVAGITGKTVDQVQDARQDGVTYGAQAAAAGKLDQFKDERLAQYKLRLDEAVKAGRLTQAEADKLYDAMKTRMAACTGNGTGVGNGAGCGMGGGMGRGQGGGLGRGMGNGAGCGMRSN